LFEAEGRVMKVDSGEKPPVLTPQKTH